jgi:hypothetical protein
MNSEFPFSRALLVVQLGSTLPLAGLIWMIQVVHYPLFAHVGKNAFAAYHESHVRLITLVVAPLMLVELVTLITRMYSQPIGAVEWCGAVCVAAAWITTMALSVPAHNSLAIEFNPQVLGSLVVTNWIRTLAWTIHSGCLLASVLRLVPHSK